MGRKSEKGMITIIHKPETWGNFRTKKEGQEGEYPKKGGQLSRRGGKADKKKGFWKRPFPGVKSV